MKNKHFFDSKKGPLPSRKHDVLNGNTSSFLIITEGKQTEPLYFNGIKKYINRQYGSNIDIQFPTIKVHGTGKSTTSLVEEAISKRAHAPQLYQYCWVVFDKDDNPDFDEAIALAGKNEINVAWSNQSFEFWLCLHFGMDTTPRPRGDWEKKLDAFFRKSGFSSKGYKKNSDDLLQLPLESGRLKQAVDNATKVEADYSLKIPASKRDPCTTVHKLIQALSPYLKDLL